MSDNTPNPPAPTVEANAPRRIADGVFVIEDRRVPLVPNIGIVLGNEKALVIDTGMGRRNGERVLAAARALAGSRPLILTLTHFHPEHGYGADAFKGNAEIVYNRAQADELADKGEAYLGMFKGMGPSIAEALAGTELVAADRLYADAEHLLDLGGRKVLLKSWGKAHTRGDQIVYLPDERVLFTGDLAEEKTFPIFPWFPPNDMDIDAGNWVKALDDCLALQPSTVVPGHGDIGGAAILTGVRDYIVDVAAKVAAARGEGSDEQIVAALAPRIRAQHPDWHFPEWIDFAIRYQLAQQA
ncbi:MBL fold metallo-hydrolase [Mesorhizobium sp. NPDC059054]|uniref:MBL fold metallo-hydrolase n=1 Tax=Mesorhizobium sp. NPDC059054 TaxID=3346711 RepID=UPI00368FFE4C